MGSLMDCVVPTAPPSAAPIWSEYQLVCICGHRTVFTHDNPRNGPKGWFRNQVRKCKCGGTLPPLREKNGFWEAKCKCGAIKTIIDNGAVEGSAGVYQSGKHFKNRKGRERKGMESVSRLKQEQQEKQGGEEVY